jgi:hypothetical protein
MKAILRSLFVFTIFSLSIIVGIPLGIIVIVFSYLTITNKCDFYTIDVLPSPTAELSLARVEKRCSRDEDERPMMFALLHPGERIESKSVFLTSADYEGITSAYYRGIRPPLSIFSKWTDERNLLVAAPEGSTLKKGRNEYRGVHIKYSFYPIDSDKTKDEYLRRQVDKRVRFEPRFRMDGGVGVPGIGCLLDLTAYDGEYLDQLSLSMVARTTFPVKANDRGKIVLNEAYSVYDFQIVARDEILRPHKHATDADVVGFAPKDGRSTLWAYNLNYPGTRAPSGVPAPKWDFGYNPKDPHDIISIAEKIRMVPLLFEWAFGWTTRLLCTQAKSRPTRNLLRCLSGVSMITIFFDTPRLRTNQD